MSQGKQMKEGSNGVGNLVNENENLIISNFEETEIINRIQVLEQKIKLLENKNPSVKAINNESCRFKTMCFTAKSKTGLCPCELYR